MDKPKIVAVDAMGGDNAPFEIVKGCVDASLQYNVKILLVGKKNVIEKELSAYSYSKDLIEIVNADEVIETNDIPTTAIKNKKNSSMVIGLNLLKEGSAGAFVSAGNTGALLAGGTFIVGRIKGIERPALGTVLPTKSRFVFLIDSGANVDSKPSYLAQFAKMGSVYAQNIFNIENPRIGLVNIGVEKEKGNSLTKEAYVLLENAGLNFIGNVESRDIPDDACDVAVCDGFVGNIILKFAEGVSSSIFSIIKEEIMSGTVSKVGGKLLTPAFKNIKKKFDYRETGGAPFLGLKSLVVKAHGSSDAMAVKNAVYQSFLFIEKDIAGKIEEKL